MGNINDGRGIFRNTERIGTQYQTEKDDLSDIIDNVDVHHGDICILQFSEYGRSDVWSIHIFHSLELPEIISKGGAHK